MREIKYDEVKKFAKNFRADPQARLAQNAITQNSVATVAENRDIINSFDTSMSVRVDKWKVTNQKQSGRCWLFSGLNSFKKEITSVTGVRNFEFSQAYPHFWDKLEKANYFLSAMIDLADRPADDRLVSHLLFKPIEDGGQWNMFVALINKYGAVPKYAMPETESSSNTKLMNRSLEMLLRKAARDIRQADPEKRDEIREAAVADVYRILAIHLGTPPSEFLWQYEDKDGNFRRKGVMTPQAFATRFFPNINEYVCIVNDPRNEYGKLYTVEYLGNVVGAKPVTYLNVPIDVMKKATIATLKNGEPVWMGCDTGKQSDRERGIWDGALYDFEGTYGVEMEMGKADSLVYGEALMTHAMVFTGVDLDEDGKPRRWRVENSWGDAIGDKGFFTMNDSWFEPHVFEVAVRRSYVPAEYLDALAGEVKTLPAWDPMGALA